MNPISLLMLCCAFMAAVAAMAAVDVTDVIMEQQRHTMRTLFHALTAPPLLMARSGAVPVTFDISSQDLERCFQYSEQKHLRNLAIYRNQTNFCRNTAAESKTKLSQQTTGKRKSVVAASGSACARLNACQNINDGLQFFACYAEEANTGSTELKGVSMSSNVQASFLKMEYEQIDFEQTTCQSDALKLYNTASLDTDDELEKCMAGQLLPVNTTTPESTIASTENTTN